MLSRQHTRPARVRRVVAVGAAMMGALPALALAGYRDDVGFTNLQTELGAAIPTGAGVLVSQVEAYVTVDGQQTWAPDPSNAEFTGKTITQVYPAPAGIYSGHATAVGQIFYGNYLSTSPSITSITGYWANRWIVDDFLWPSGSRRPLYTTSRVVNHSWVGATGTVDADLLRRMDYVVETDDQLQVVAHSASSAPNINPLFSSAFNVIAVGRTIDTVNTGSASADTLYIAGRARPDVVAPADSPSIATPMVSSMAALLVQVGHGNTALSTDPVQTSYTNRAGLVIRNAERAEVIKAALMAGADRVTANTSAGNLLHYRDTPAHQTGNGLDIRYGAGQANIYNSYRIIASGEQNSTEDGGPGSGSTARGFDYDPAFGGSTGANAVANYPLPVAATPQLLTASLVWHVDINGGTYNNFNNAATFRDLSLSVVDVTNPSVPVVVYTSQSTTENTENAWLEIPAGAQYALRVARASGTAFSYDYGIAWQALPDTDGDGAHDGQDNCIDIANGPIVADAGGNSQLDADGDRYGNMCDADLNNSGLVTSADYSILRQAMNTTDPVADLNGSGLVTTIDYTLARGYLNLPPGPSALAP